MTKTQIALTLANQYAEIEEDKFEWYDLMKEAREQGDQSEREYAKKRYQIACGKLDTIRQSAELIEITDKQWLKAIETAYIGMSRTAL